MVTEELLRYVEFQSNRGVDQNSIKMTLLQAGWTGEDVNEAFTVVNTVTQEDVSDKAVASNPVTNEGSAQQPNSVNRPASPQAYVQPTESTQPNVQENESEIATNATVGSTAEDPYRNQPEVETPEEIKTLKYRTAQEWQDNNLATQATKFGSGNRPPVTAATNPDPVAGIHNDVVKPASVRVLPELEKFGDGSVYRPRVNSLTSASPAGGQYSPRATPDLIKGNPASELKNQKQIRRQRTKKKGKSKLVLLTLVLLLAFMATGYYFFGNIFSKPEYGIAPLVTAMVSQDYIYYRADGIVPINSDSSILPPTLELVGDQLPFSLQGLINPRDGKSGFSFSAKNFDLSYVFDGSSSFARLSDLTGPQFAEVVGRWFDFSSEAQTTALLQLISNQPSASVPEFANQVGQALSTLQSDGLVELNYQESVTQQVADETLIADEYVADVLQFNFDTSLLSARLNGDGKMLADLIEHTGIQEVQGWVYVNRNTGLVTRLDVELVTRQSSYPLTIDFFYDYSGKEISAPQDTISSSEVIPLINFLSAGSEVETVRSQVKLLGTDASLYYDTNNSFAEFCASEAVATTTEFLTTNYELVAACQQSMSEFVFQAPLPAAGYYSCVDSSYVEKVTQTAMIPGINSCGESADYPVETADNPASTNDTVSDDEFFE